MNDQKIYSRMTQWSVGCCGALLVFSCSASESAGPARGSGGAGNTGNVGNSPGSGNTGNGGSASTGTGNTGNLGNTSGSGNTGNASATAGAGNAAAGTPQVPLPFVLEPTGTMGYGFAPSGYMPDGMNGVTSSPTTAMDPNSTCDGSAPASAQGVCRTFTLTHFSSIDWSGVYWQYPDSNWGDKPGLRIAPGATKIHFQAKGKKGGEIIQAWAGGIGWDKGARQSASQYADTFDVAYPPMSFTLTADWQSFAIDLPAGTNYSAGVVGGFAWGMSKPTGWDGTTPITFYITDIVWQ